MTTRESKQVLVLRKDLRMRKGKMVAQGAHASIVWMVERAHQAGKGEIGRVMTKAEIDWVNGSFTKICVGVDSEEELERVHRAAVDAGVSSHLITDAGRTEFHGVPTKTCLAVGPDWSDRVDEITGGLTLL